MLSYFDNYPYSQKALTYAYDAVKNHKPAIQLSTISLNIFTSIGERCSEGSPMGSVFTGSLCLSRILSGCFLSVPFRMCTFSGLNGLAIVFSSKVTGM